MTLAARIDGIGLLGPGLVNWTAARAVLAGEAPYAPQPTLLPAPESLPATERRRAGVCVKLALAAGLEAAERAGREPRECAAIFASSSGDGENCHAICAALASDDRAISPTRFHNSVHNAPAGYWGIATGAMTPADCIAAFDGSFAAGLLEALARLAAEPERAVLLIAYDAPYPEPLNGARPLPDAFGMALALSAVHGAAPGPRIAVDFTHAAPSRIPDHALERLRRAIPAARALPLLVALARGESARPVLEYLDDLALQVELRA